MSLTNFELNQMVEFLKKEVKGIKNEDLKNLIAVGFNHDHVVALLSGPLYNVDLQRAELLANAVDRMKAPPRPVTQGNLDDAQTTQVATATTEPKSNTLMGMILLVLFIILAVLLANLWQMCGLKKGAVSKSDVASIKRDVEATRSAVTGTDDNGYSATVMDVARDIRTNMVKKEALDGLAKKDDLKDLAKKDDLKDLATKDDLSKLATTDQLKKVERKVDTIISNQETIVLPAEDVDDDSAAPTLPPGKTIVKVCKGGRKCKRVQ